jgi:membrane protein
MAINEQWQPEEKQPEEKEERPQPLEKVASLVQDGEEAPLLKKGVGPFRAFFTKFSNDWTMNLQAGALAYNLVVAIFPILLALSLLFGLVLGSLGSNVQHLFITTVATVLPQGLGQGIVQQVLGRIQHAGGMLGLLTLVTAIFGGSRLFILMEDCFDLIYHLQPRPFLQQNLMALGMLLLFAILIPMMLLASSVPALLLSLLKTTVLSGIAGWPFLLSVLGILSSLLLSWVLFEALYIVIPNQHISFRDSWRGAVMAAIGLQIYLTLFPFYATHFLKGYDGQAGFALLMIAFFYYFAVILLLGAQVNAFFAEQVQKTPTNLAGLVHKETSHDEKSPEEQQVQATPEHKHDMDTKGK